MSQIFERTQNYTKTLQTIRDALHGSKTWIFIDETSDATGRAIAHFIVGKLVSYCEGEPYLFRCEELYKTNSSTVLQLVLTSLQMFMARWATV